MDPNYLGQIAALATALAWSVSATNFTVSGRRIGAAASNYYRITLGFIFLCVAHFIMFGRIWPNASLHQGLLLVISGLAGIAIGDTFLFKAYVDIGPRIGLLIFNINPFLTAFLASMFLGEKVNLNTILGMTVTIGGVAFALCERNPNNVTVATPHYLRGIIFAFLAAVGQSVGFVIAKPVMTGADGLAPLSATLMRIAFAMLGFWVIAMIRGDVALITTHMKDKTAVKNLIFGSFLGAFLGIWMSLIALKYTKAAVAATLMSTMPVMILPVVAIRFKEKISWKAIFGAVVAVIGVAILFGLLGL